MRHFLPMVALAAALLGPNRARADDHPTIASDGLFVGARLEPGGAFLLAYDLDIYLTGDRVLSLGPAASFAFLGEDGSDLGRRQDWLLTVDFLRFKVALTEGGSPLRPYLFFGGGMTYASLPAQESAERMVLVLPDETPATARIRYEAIEDFGGQLSAGGGADLYFIDNLAFSVALVAHLRLGDQDRIPLFWAEVMAGLRFGL